MIIQSQHIKDDNTKWHKKLTNLNVGIFLKTEECLGEQITPNLELL